MILGLGIVLSPAYWIEPSNFTANARGESWDERLYDVRCNGKNLRASTHNLPRDTRFRDVISTENPDMALPWVIKRVAVGISGLMFVAIIAALQSTIDSGVNTTALMILGIFAKYYSSRAMTKTISRLAGHCHSAS